MTRIITIKKQGENFFILQIHNVASEENQNKSIHTFFLSKTEIEGLIRNSLSALGTILNNSVENQNNSELDQLNKIIKD